MVAPPVHTFLHRQSYAANAPRKTKQQKCSHPTNVRVTCTRCHGNGCRAYQSGAEESPCTGQSVRARTFEGEREGRRRRLRERPPVAKMAETPRGRQRGKGNRDSCKHIQQAASYTLALPLRDTLIDHRRVHD